MSCATPFKTPFSVPAGQSGSVLIVGLILLAVIAIITVASVSLPGNEIKMAYNTKVQTQALMIAEHGLTEAESRVLSQYGGVPIKDFESDTEDCVYGQDGEVTINTRWCQVNLPDSDSNATEGRYVIHYIGPRPLEVGTGNTLTDRYFFRSTGDGRADTGNRRVQSIVMTADAG